MLKNTFKEILGASGSKIDILKAMPQRIEGGVVYDFNGNAMFNVTDEDEEILALDRVGARFTDALAKTYLLCLDSVTLDIVGGETPVTTEDTETYAPTVEEQVLEAVGEGDKKLVRKLCKDLKDKWFALDSDEVEDAIDDIKDCVADKDVKAVQEIFTDMVDVAELTNEPVSEADAKAEPVSETAQEIVNDIESAIKDEDEDDLKELLIELADEVGKDSDLYKKWLAKATPADSDTVDDIVDDIVAALKDAVQDDDLKDAKEILKELGEEVGTDSELYKEWAAKVEPKKTSRRNRRGK